MHEITAKMQINDEDYLSFLSGERKVFGLLKDDANIVRRHIDAVITDDSDVNSDTNTVIALAVVAGVAFTAVAGYGIYKGVNYSIRKKAEKKLNISLGNYVTAAKEGKLTKDLVDNLIVDIDRMIKINKGRKLVVYENMKSLIQAVYEYTNDLAKCNNVKLRNISNPSNLEACDIIDFKEYLSLQKKILDKAE